MHSLKSITLPDALKIPLNQALQPLQAKRILIALSGGADSKCLFYALLALKKTGLHIACAHVDHGWREESHLEALSLKEEVESFGIPFHLKVLDPGLIKGNKELYCREERLNFFLELAKAHHYEAVFLAHHQDDLAETILKRILEGASLSKIGGIKRHANWQGLVLIRPWLNIPKTSLLAFLKTENIPFFEDTTNQDTQFLRARLRLDILPDLSHKFGKSVKGPLLRHAQELNELQTFMQKRFQTVLLSGRDLDCRNIESIFEAKWLIRAWLKFHALDISYAALDRLVDLIFQKKGDKRVVLGTIKVEVDRGRLFLRPAEIKIKGPLDLEYGDHVWGEWKVKVEKAFRADVERLGWQAAFDGKLTLLLGKGEFQLDSYLNLQKSDKQMLQKKWTQEKIPSFFRHFVPVLIKDGQLMQECLSLKRTCPHQMNISKKVILYRE